MALFEEQVFQLAVVDGVDAYAVISGLVLGDVPLDEIWTRCSQLILREVVPIPAHPSAPGQIARVAQYAAITNSRLLAGVVCIVLGVRTHLDENLGKEVIREGQGKVRSGACWYGDSCLDREVAGAACTWTSEART